MGIITKMTVWLAGMLALSACAQADILNAIIPTGGMEIHKDIAYGDLPRQTLDVYTPKKLETTAPVVIFFHGGAWKMGNKDLYLFVAEALTSRGYVVVIPNYRLYPDAYFPAFMDDAAQAFAWTRKNIAQHKGQPENIFLSGHSAGAHMAVLMTVDERYLKKAGMVRSMIRGTIGIAGPYDFLPMTDPDVIGVFSKRPEKESQPINYVGKDMPPMLLVHGDTDDEVLLKNTVNMTDALRVKGNEVEMNVYPKIGHIVIILSIAKGFREKTPLLDQIDAFIRQHKQ
ncbi:MAG: alpha/beta hydrolase [Alphaproteobacteria bacterium]|nr:alpha/beta hydrolase [Alphaproteobacteria bacterium]